MHQCTNAFGICFGGGMKIQSKIGYKQTSYSLTKGQHYTIHIGSTPTAYAAHYVYYMYYNYVIKGMLHGGENMNFMFLPQEHKICIIELYGVMLYLLIV